MELLRALHPDDIVTGEPEAAKSQQEEREQELADHVVWLLNLAVVDQGHCQMCDLRGDQHTALCPVPLMEDWLAARP